MKMNKMFKFLPVCSAIAIAMVTCAAFSATTTSARPSIASTTSKVKVTNTASNLRTPTVTAPKTTATPAPVLEPELEPEPEPEKVIVVDNKTSQFDSVLSDIADIAPDTSSSELAERVRQQRALLDNTGAAAVTATGQKVGANACDSALRKCMAEKCGNDFTKCANDSTTVWGDKMDSCRRTTQCSGHEYNLIAPEIMADRDMNVRILYYNSVLNCGNKYNSCIFNECGKYLDKCLSKSDGDRAVSKCESIARECREQDSGLSARVMNVFGGLRTIATEQVKKDEARLYELRDLMRGQCERLGAMFDERTLDCVYTVNFFAGDDTETPKASKKLYAGDSFQCNANWFGVDVTTFKENAYRLTRSQRSASAAALGAGVGTAAGLAASGAISRAVDTQNVEKAAKQACAQDGGTWKNGKCEKNSSNTSEDPTKPHGSQMDRSETTSRERMDNVIKQVTSTPEMQNAINSVLKQDDASAESAAAAGAAVATVNNIETTQNQQTDETAQKQTELVDKNSTIQTTAPVATDINECKDTYVLSSDKKTVTETIRRTQNNSTCETRRTDRYPSYSNGMTRGVSASIDLWSAESDPGWEHCKNICNQIESLEPKLHNSRKLVQPECLKQCAPAIQTQCDRLIGKQDNKNDNRLISKLIPYYNFAPSAELVYWCEPRFD